MASEGVSFHEAGGSVVSFHEASGSLVFTVGDIEFAIFQVIDPACHVFFSQPVRRFSTFVHLPTGFTGPRLCRYLTPDSNVWRAIYAWDWGEEEARTLLASEQPGFSGGFKPTVFDQLNTETRKAVKALDRLNAVRETTTSRYAPEFAEYYGVE